jgi:VCBS repeat-containing protein
MILSLTYTAPVPSYAATPQANGVPPVYLPMLGNVTPNGAALAEVSPRFHYLDDSAGTLFTFSITNTGGSTGIGAVEIRRPSSAWSLLACPQAPAGWTAQLSTESCRYRSADGPVDDIAPRQNSRNFQLRASTIAGAADRPGVWQVFTSSSNSFDPAGLIDAAPISLPWLSIVAHSWEILDVVIAAAPPAPGSPCPAPNKQAIADSSATLLVCGKNRMNVVGIPLAARSSIGGSMLASSGSFSSGPIPASSPSSVVLGVWSNARISPVAGASRTIVASLSSGLDADSPTLELRGYDARNTPPSAANDSFTVAEDAALTVPAPGVLANDSDPDGDPISAFLVDRPANGALALNADGSFTYTPGANFNGTDSFTYRAQDSFGAQSALAIVAIVVTPVPDAPTAADQSVSATENIPAPIDLAGLDVDGDNLSFIIVSDPANGTLSPLGAPNCIAGSCIARVTYTPTPSFNGTDSFTFKVSDGTLESPVAIVSITVNAVDDPPVAVDDSATLTEDDPATLIDVLANDTDLDGGPRRIASATQPANGTVVVAADGSSLTYQPDADYCNTPPGTALDTFTYTLAPGDSTATVSVSVTCVNDAPVAAADSYSVDEDSVLTVAAPGVLANDTDAENDALVAALVGGPSHGSLTLSANGAFSYTPVANYNGADSFTYNASDGVRDSNIVTVSLTVNPVNDKPSANAQTAITEQDDPVNITLSGSDLESCELSFSIVAGPTNGTLGVITGSACTAGTPNADSATVVYTPSAGFNGSDSFTYRVTDSGDGAAAPLDADPVTVSITVNPPNAAPVVTPATFDIAENSANNTFVGTVSASDADVGDTLSYAITAGNSGGAFAIDATDGEITVASSAALDFETTPSFSLTVTVTDDGTPQASGSAAITVNLSNVNEAPSDIALSNSSVAENQPAGTTVGAFSANDPDAGDTHTFTLVSGTGDTDNAFFAIDGSALETAAVFDFETRSSYSIRVRATDAGGLTFDKVFTIAVADSNDAPTAIDLSNSSVAENQPAGTTVGAFTTTDPDAADTHIYTLVAGTGDADNSFFAIDGSTLESAASFDFELKSSYSIRVQADDGNGGTFARSFTISVTNVNEAPSDIVLSNSSVAENQPADTTVGTFIATDPDAGDTHTFALVSGTGDTDNASFTIDGTTLKTAASFNFEVKSSYSIRVRATDAGGLTFDKVLTISVTDVNDAPVLADLEATALAYTENDPATPVTAAITVSDEDDSTLSGATVSITIGYQNGEDLLAFVNQLGISGSFNAATGVLTLAGSASLADYTTALRAVTYVNTSANPSTTARTIAFRVSDGAADSNILGRQVTITAVNDAPVNSVPAGQTVNEDTDLVFSAANGNAISISDVDAGSSAVKLSLSVTNGTLTLPSTTGLTFEDGTANGQAAVNVTGSISAINTALNGLRYRGTANYNSARGPENLVVTTNDQGNTGTGGARSDIDTIAIAVTPVNDAPTAQPQSFAAHTNMKLSLSGLLAGASDPDSGDGGYIPVFTVANLSVTSPSGGTISNLDASTGSFDFDPPPGFVGNVTFTYTVCDSGNPAPAQCSAPATATVTVSGPVIWFVNAAAPAGGDGRLSNPFNSLAAADAVDAPNHRVFLYSGNYVGGLALNNGQWLVGQGATGSFDSVMSITPPVATIARPTLGGTRPTVQSTLILASGARLRGLNIFSGSSTGLADPAGAINGVEVSEVSVSSTTGVAVNLSNNNGVYSFTAISAGTGASGPSSGIILASTTGSFTVTGTGAAQSGGTIQRTSGPGISLSGAQAITLNLMRITVTAGSGVKGSGVSGFAFTDGEISFSGFTSETAPVDPTATANIDTANIAFNNGSNGTSLGTEQNLTGAVTISGSTLTNGLYHGVDIFNFAGTISSMTITGNNFTSGTTTGTGGTSFGSAIRVNASGGAGNAASVTAASISSNSIVGFPANAGIQLLGGNQNATGPGGGLGIAGSATETINVTDNLIRGHSSATKLGTQAILFTIAGANGGSRSQGNINIARNGTGVDPIANITGIAISPNALGFATVTAIVENNVIAPNNTVGSGGISGGTGAVVNNNDTPQLTITVQNNTISNTDGNGILLVARGATATLRAKVQNNTVAAPLAGVRPGIRIDSGNASSINDTVCLNISGNSSAGSSGSLGIGLRKQGTNPAVNVFAVNGMAATSSPGVEAYINGLNPAGNNTQLLSAQSGFTGCSLP